MRALLVLALVLRTRAALAQCGPTQLPVQDTLRARVLPAIVVTTAERSPSLLGASVAAVTRLPALELARVPHATLADLLRYTPGFSLVDFDGLGFDPQLMVRGFYGGGEAEYVIVMVDGRPVNRLEIGTVAWDVLPPLGAIRAVEVVRGGASSLYGDAAIGGVINVITRAQSGDSPAHAQASAGGGSYGTWRASAELERPMGKGGLGLGGGFDRTRGFRRHAERTAARAGATLTLNRAAESRLALTLASHWREYDEPGPLLESLLAQDRRGSDPLFRFDHSKDRDAALSLDWSRKLGERTRLNGMVGGELRRIEAVRTLALAPGFGDTKERHAASDRAAAGVQLDVADSPLPGADRLSIGLEGSHGSLDSRYYGYTFGTRAQYAAATGQRGDLDTRGSARRTSGAAYLQYTLQASALLRISAGARLDHLQDHFDEQFPGGTPSRSTTHSALSPKVGLSLGYLRRDRNSGNLYLAAGRSFKAPTLDQLYDLRNIPVPFPPFAIRTANPDLEPQRGTSIEAGLYHSLEAADHLQLGATLSVYQMDMHDELDFDVESFRYVNVGRSRHRGMELGGRLDGSRIAAFAGWTLQAATSRSGANSGKRLKAIPRHTLNGGITVQPLSQQERLQASLFATHARGVFLDDANARTLPGYTRLDARALLRVAAFDLLLDVRNLLGERYSSSGFLDPAGSGEAYLYPAAGRVVELGIRYGW